LNKQKNSIRRACCAQALGLLEDPRAIKPLIHSLVHDKSDKVREECARALGILGAVVAIDPLLYAMENDRDEYVRLDAGASLGFLPDISDNAACMKRLETAAQAGNIGALAAMAWLKGGAYLEHLNKIILPGSNYSRNIYCQFRWGKNDVLVTTFEIETLLTNGPSTKYLAYYNNMFKFLPKEFPRHNFHIVDDNTRYKVRRYIYEWFKNNKQHIFWNKDDGKYYLKKPGQGK
jgi:hypothetical protein